MITLRPIAGADADALYALIAGTVASRRIFERHGFRLEATIRRAAHKRGRFVDTWIFGLLPEELGA